jgi:hypothetical protein
MKLLPRFYKAGSVASRLIEYTHFQAKLKHFCSLIPFKSAASGRVIPRGYACPGRMLVKSFIPFRVSR